VEIAVPAASPRDLWAADHGAAVLPPASGRGTPCASKAALPLHGHELGPGITPLQAGLGLGGRLGQGRVPRPRRRWPPSASAGSPESWSASPPTVVAPPRADCEVFAGDTVVGVVSSGNFSRVLGHGIALAFVAPAVAEGAEVAVDVRGTRLAGRVVPTPFVAKHSVAEQPAAKR
jgi:aminomethyltransferase